LRVRWARSTKIKIGWWILTSNLKRIA
jgi:hypothetical protein